MDPAVRRFGSGADVWIPSSNEDRLKLHQQPYGAHTCTKIICFASTLQKINPGLPSG
jgi:hypothetical protein